MKNYKEKGFNSRLIKASSIYILKGEINERKDKGSI